MPQGPLGAFFLRLSCIGRAIYSHCTVQSSVGLPLCPNRWCFTSPFCIVFCVHSLCQFACRTLALLQSYKVPNHCPSIALSFWQGLQHAVRKKTICHAFAKVTLGCTALLHDIRGPFCIHVRVACIALLHLQQMAWVIFTVYAYKAMS